MRATLPRQGWATAGLVVVVVAAAAACAQAAAGDGKAADLGGCAQLIATLKDTLAHDWADSSADALRTQLQSKDEEIRNAHAKADELRQLLARQLTETNAMRMLVQSMDDAGRGASAKIQALRSLLAHQWTFFEPSQERCHHAGGTGAGGGSARPRRDTMYSALQMRTSMTQSIMQAQLSSQNSRMLLQSVDKLWAFTTSDTWLAVATGGAPAHANGKPAPPGAGTAEPAGRDTDTGARTPPRAPPVDRPVGVPAGSDKERLRHALVIRARARAQAQAAATRAASPDADARGPALGPLGVKWVRARTYKKVIDFVTADKRVMAAGQIPTRARPPPPPPRAATQTPPPQPATNAGSATPAHPAADVPSKGHRAAKSKLLKACTAIFVSCFRKTKSAAACLVGGRTHCECAAKLTEPLQACAGACWQTMMKQMCSGTAKRASEHATGPVPPMRRSAVTPSLLGLPGDAAAAWFDAVYATAWNYHCGEPLGGALGGDAATISTKDRLFQHGHVAPEAFRLDTLVSLASATAANDPPGFDAFVAATLSSGETRTGMALGKIKAAAGNADFIWRWMQEEGTSLIFRLENAPKCMLQQSRAASVLKLREHISHALGFVDASVHVYVAARHQSNTLSMHADLSDVLVVQLNGTKTWEVCVPHRVPATVAVVAAGVQPTVAQVAALHEMHRHAQYDLYNVALMEKMQARMSPGRSSVNHGEAGERGTIVERMISGPQDFVNRSEMACTKHVMQPGDRMYLPFGVLHSAVTGPHGSVHVTVELEREGTTWADLFKGMVSSALDQAGIVRPTGASRAQAAGAGAEQDQGARQGRKVEGDAAAAPRNGGPVDHSTAIGLTKNTLSILEASLRHQPQPGKTCPNSNGCLYPKAVVVTSADLVMPVAMLGALGPVGSTVPQIFQREFVRVVYGPLAQQVLAIATSSDTARPADGAANTVAGHMNKDEVSNDTTRGNQSLNHPHACFASLLANSLALRQIAHRVPGCPCVCVCVPGVCAHVRCHSAWPTSDSGRCHEHCRMGGQRCPHGGCGRQTSPADAEQAQRELCTLHLTDRTRSRTFKACNG